MPALAALALAGAVAVGGLQVERWDKAAHGQLVTDCDRLSAYGSDRDRIAPAVSREQMDVPRALEACRSAVAAEPRNPRLHYQLARVLTYSGDADGAWRHRVIAAEAGYPSALFVIGYQKAFPPKGGPAEVCAGADLIRHSARAGAFAAQVGYVAAVLEGPFRPCTAPDERAELRQFLDAARKGADGYFETLLVKSLGRELDAWLPRNGGG